ncbi:protein E6-like [Spinacia oleracea]|uniref:Protein E6-like n=1 Tax=Spinacia oleracea TaxID=3562 RepID=A0A9R0IJF4_SPIOL|nr:protein E6-like [Spinacia oleracea]
MAFSLKSVFLFCLLTTLIFSLQTSARDEEFFSKLTRNRDDTTTTTTTTATANTKNNYLNNKEDAFVPLEKLDEPIAPTIPQSTEAGYGLYGHDIDLDPASTTTTTTPNTKTNYLNNKKDDFVPLEKLDDHEQPTVPQTTKKGNGLYGHDIDLDHPSTTTTTTTPNTKNNYLNNKEDDFVPLEKQDEQPTLPQTMKTSYGLYGQEADLDHPSTTTTTTATTTFFYDINTDEDHYYNKYENLNIYDKKKGAVKQQGMSDTRFMYNGKYFYDVKAENNNKKYVSYNTDYNNNGYYGPYGNKETNYEEVYDNNNKMNDKVLELTVMMVF